MIQAWVEYKAKQLFREIELPEKQKTERKNTHLPEVLAIKQSQKHMYNVPADRLQ